MNSYQKALEERKKQHLLRTLPLPPEGIDFYSNDYLGLAKSSVLSQKIAEEYQSIPNKQNGASGSRLLSGNSNYSEDVENKIANFHHAESALIYSSGYAANLGLISCLATKETTLFCDELIHASLIDGARLGHSKKVRFAHNDPSDLEQKLQNVEGQKLVVVESIYSMDGDVCPLREITEICKKQDAMLIVDEAHSMAVIGKEGEGLTQSLGLEQEVLARIMTYGKGPGIHGAAVVGPTWLREYQINFSRSLIFSTAPADHQFASISAMYDVLPEVETEQQKLKSITDYFVSKRKESSGKWLESDSQIQSLIVPGNEEVVSLGKKLLDAGINALPIRKPSVAEGAERIRFCLHSYNTKEEIDLLFKTLTSP
jgi:8-amino-7-oxononanoate synthase